jgi:hypothetical protein
MLDIGYGWDLIRKLSNTVSIMTTIHMKRGEQQILETSCISNIPNTMDIVQYNIHIRAK